MLLSTAVSALTVLYFLSSLLLAILNNLYPYILLRKQHSAPVDMGLSVNNNTFLAEIPESLWFGIYANHGISYVVGEYFFAETSIYNENSF